VRWDRPREGQAKLSCCCRCCKFQSESLRVRKVDRLIGPSGPDAATSLSMLSKVVAALGLTPELVAAVTADLDPQRTFQYLTLPTVTQILQPDEVAKLPVSGLIRQTYRWASTVPGYKLARNGFKVRLWETGCVGDLRAVIDGKPLWLRENWPTTPSRRSHAFMCAA
jgi:hypothetical protein